MKKARLMFLLVALIVLVAAGCAGTPTEIEMTGMDGEAVSVSTEGMSDEQIAAVQEVADGEADMMSLMQSGMFSRDELTQLGIGNGGAMPGARGDIDMESLDVDELSNEQIAYVEQIVEGEKTVQEAVDEGVLTMDEVQEIGLMGARPMNGEMPEGGFAGGKEQTPQGE